MARRSVVNISYALFFLALVEVLAWSLPLVHSATGGSTQDLQGYFARETHNVAEVDSSLYQKEGVDCASEQRKEIKRHVSEQSMQLLAAEEKQQLAELAAQMSLGFIVRIFALLFTTCFGRFFSRFTHYKPASIIFVWPGPCRCIASVAHFSKRNTN